MSAKSHGPVCVIGAGIGGLSAAIALATAGVRTVVYESRDQVGGKARTLFPGGMPVHSGPTVLTLRDVFDELFEAAGTRLDDHVRLNALPILARHFWSGGAQLDLYADRDRNVEAIREFAGDDDARGYRRFAGHAEAVFDTMEHSFMRASRPGPLSLAWRVGPGGLPGLLRSRPFKTLWNDLGRYFDDPRLRQLFGRYATYVGSSPFAAPAVLALVAHAEQRGVWSIDGGIPALARAMQLLAGSLGVEFRCSEQVIGITVASSKVTGIVTDRGLQNHASAVVYNGDINQLPDLIATPNVIDTGTDKPSLSAVTFSLQGKIRGPALTRHNVFFSSDYAGEFDTLFRQRRLPRQPTVYVCAQARTVGPGGKHPEFQKESSEPLFCLINAPALNSHHDITNGEVDQCRRDTMAHLSACGVELDSDDSTIEVTSPGDFDHLFPGSRGALYGQANHGPLASFRRPTARTQIGGLFLAGGGVHPGPGVPMVAISGRLAAQEVLRCFDLI